MRATAAAVAAFGVLLLAGSAGAQNPRPWASKVPQEFRQKRNPLPNSPEVVAKGKEHFTNTCMPCHGEQALGDGPAAEFMEAKPKPLIVNGKVSVPDGVAFWVISNGIDGTAMVSLGDTLSEQERWEIIRYLHTLAAPAPAATPAAVATPATAPAAGAAAPPPPAAAPAPAAKKRSAMGASKNGPQDAEPANAK